MQQNYLSQLLKQQPQGLLADPQQMPQMQPQAQPQLPLNLLIELLRSGQQGAFLDQLRPKTPQEGTTTTGIRG